MHNLRKCTKDVLVGVNLIRERLDLPQVSLVAIIDHDKQGFLRSERSLTQTAGRAARNINSKVIMYADKITESMRKTIEETDRRRIIQMAYNEKHGITPQQIIKPLENVLGKVMGKDDEPKPYIEPDFRTSEAADPVIEYMSKDQIEKAIAKIQKEMKKVVKDLDFIEAARLRDEMLSLEKKLGNLK
jgi:excinuclease ABC subunit B